MNHTKVTLVYIGVALALGALAFATSPSPPDELTATGQGGLFYPNFKDPTAATAIEVASFDDKLAKTKVFKVALKDGAWVIPSHFDYPAEAKNKLTQVATEYTDIRKDIFITENSKEHEKLGVIDPLEAENPAKGGRGLRLTLRDSAGTALCDYIIGKPVDGRSGFFNVRGPDSRQVFACKIQANIPTKFEDWIKPDLLDTSWGNFSAITINRYDINELSRDMLGRFFTCEIRAGEYLELKKVDNNWTLAGLNADDEEAQAEKIKDVARAIDEITIVDVRPKPEQIVQVFKRGVTLFDTPPASTLKGHRSLGSLGSGFYFFEEGEGNDQPPSVYANEGEVRVAAANGVVYDLRVGEIARGTGESVTAPKEGEKKEETGDNRYLLVTVKFDQSLLGEEPREPEKPESLRKKEEDRKKAEDEKNKPPSGDKPPSEKPPEPPDEETPEEKKYHEDYDKWRSDHDSWDRRVKEGKDKVAELQKRFADWYYVISESQYRKLKVERKDLTKKKPKPGDEITTPSGLKYQDLVIGDGTEAVDGKDLSVLYVGKFKGGPKDGQVFDQNQNREVPFPFTLGQRGVIKGWDEGIKGMKVGGKRRLICSPDLAYGAAGKGDIPPNSTLEFEVELLKVE